MAMQDWAEDACDQIDAGFFSGDSFHDADALARIEWYMDRWQREIVSIKEIMANQKAMEECEKSDGKCKIGKAGAGSSGRERKGENRKQSVARRLLR